MMKCLLYSFTPATLTRWFFFGFVSGNVGILKYLIEELKMSPDFSDTIPMTPLHWACAYTQLEASKYLVSVGANFRRTTSQGSTIFSLACSGRNRTMMQWLLGLDLDAAVADKTGTCPIHIMAKHGPLDLLKLFIESGKANIHALDGSGRTAVDIADAHLMHEAALYLWELGVDRKVQKTLNLSLRNTRCVLKGPSHSHCATLGGTSKVLGLSFDGTLCGSFYIRKTQLRNLRIFLSSSQLFGT
jgi:hypothetical protein